MKVLIACEYSGIVRDAFNANGHDAMSCDFLPSETTGNHYKGDMFELDLESFDLIIAHPPCTYVCVSGNRHYANTQQRQDGVQFIKRIWDINVDRLCIENPVGVINTFSDLPKPQYVQPWMFGHGETKKTGLWKRNLKDLVPTNLVDGRDNRIHKMPPSKDRWKIRSTHTKFSCALIREISFGVS